MVHRAAVGRNQHEANIVKDHYGQCEIVYDTVKAQEYTSTPPCIVSYYGAAEQTHPCERAAQLAHAVPKLLGAAGQLRNASNAAEEVLLVVEDVGTDC